MMMERKQLSLRLTNEMFEKIEKDAVRRGMSINNYIVRLIEIGMKSSQKTSVTIPQKDR